MTSEERVLEEILNLRRENQDSHRELHRKIDSVAKDVANVTGRLDEHIRQADQFRSAVAEVSDDPDITEMLRRVAVPDKDAAMEVIAKTKGHNFWNSPNTRYVLIAFVVAAMIVAGWTGEDIKNFFASFFAGETGGG